jgi:hypothetical protein
MFLDTLLAYSGVLIFSLIFTYAKKHPTSLHAIVMPELMSEI